MNIHREGSYLVGSDPQGRPLLGIESGQLARCVEEAQQRQVYGVFGNPGFDFREDNLDFLTALPHLGSVWFWDVTLKDVEGIYALPNLRHFGVHPKRPGIDFTRLRTLQNVVWEYNPRDRGMGALVNLHTLHIWRYKPKHRSFEDQELPCGIEDLEIFWANPESLAGLPELPRLKRLGLHRCRNLETLADLPSIAPNLEHLVVTSCRGVIDGRDVVRRLSKLHHAFVQDAVLVKDGSLTFA